MKVALHTVTVMIKPQQWRFLIAAISTMTVAHTTSTQYDAK